MPEDSRIDPSRKERKMRRAIATLLVLIVSALTIAGQDQGERIKYVSPEGRYSVLVPTQPKLSTQDTTSADGAKVPQYLASSPDGNGVFMIGFFDYKPPVTFSFDKARDAMLKAMEATLLGEETVSLGSSPGRQLRLLAKTTDAQEFMVRARMYDVTGRVYVLQCIFPKAEDGPASTDKCAKFFDSFKVQSGP
jgi:hypothetical protein